PDALARESGLQCELPPIDLRQPLPLDAALPREVEEGGGVGEEGLDAAAFVPGEQQQGRREVAEEVARDLGAERRRLLLIEILRRAADLGVQPAVMAAGEGVRPPLA